MSVLVVLGTTAAYLYSCMSMVGRCIGAVRMLGVSLQPLILMASLLLLQVLAASSPTYVGHVYFDSSMMIITFVCAGKRGRHHTSSLHIHTAISNKKGSSVQSG